MQSASIVAECLDMDLSGMKCSVLDPEVMGLNPSQVELGMHSPCICFNMSDLSQKHQFPSASV